MSLVIRLAETPEDRQRVFRFRYEIYVEEMKRPQTYADHATRIVQEPLDETGRIYLAEDDLGRVVGTVRSNYGCDTDFGEYEDFYQLRCAGDRYPDRVSITTKLMVAREHPQWSPPARPPMEIVATETNEQRERIYRFRYSIYVEEMGKPMRGADQMIKFHHLAGCLMVV